MKSIGNFCDGCPFNFNPDQKDTDGDGFQDAYAFFFPTKLTFINIILSSCDNCPNSYNPSQVVNCNGQGITFSFFVATWIHLEH